jgi:hypothetical protein
VQELNPRHQLHHVIKSDTAFSTTQQLIVQMGDFPGIRQAETAHIFEGIGAVVWAVDGKSQVIDDTALGTDAVVEMGEGEGVQRLTCLGEVDESFDSFRIMFPDLTWARCDEGLFVGEVG